MVEVLFDVVKVLFDVVEVSVALIEVQSVEDSVVKVVQLPIAWSSSWRLQVVGL